MKTITYEFADGTVQEIEVDGELYAAHKEMVQAEKRNHWKNTRRHTSLSYLNEHEIDIPAPESGEPLNVLIEQEDDKEFWEWLSLCLDPKQIELYKMVSDGYTATEIAKREGVKLPAISRRLERIFKKIKVFSKKCKHLPSVVLIGGGNQTAYYKLRGLRK